MTEWFLLVLQGHAAMCASQCTIVIRWCALSRNGALSHRSRTAAVGQCRPRPTAVSLEPWLAVSFQQKACPTLSSTTLC